MLGGLTPAHLLIILVIALIVIGPGKLPEVGAAIGKSIREFQKATGGITDTLTGAVAQPVPPAPTPSTQVQPTTPPYYTAQSGYPAAGYPAPVAQPPMQHQPVMGIVEQAPAPPAPMVYQQPNAAVQQPPASPKVD